MICDFAKVKYKSFILKLKKHFALVCVYSFFSVWMGTNLKLKRW